MKCLVGLFFPFVLGVVLSVSLNSNIEDKKPPVVDGVGDENLDRKADQISRKLINGVGEEEGPHPKAKRTLTADGAPVEDKKPPVVDGVGDENLDRKADQISRKLINGVGEEEGPHPKAKRTLTADGAPVEDKKQPVVDGVGDENLDRKADQISRKLINGVGEEEGPHPKAKRTLAADGAPVLPSPPPPSCWTKYSPETHWCTIQGRSLISEDINKPITAAQCQAKCVARDPMCDAVEFWEKYNYACFECTDTSKITPYTNTGDLAYPVYVWIRGWRKYSLETHWCTIQGRSLISEDVNKPITAVQCQAKCVARDPMCQAVEFWEKYNYACFECTDTSKVTPYTNTGDLAYPVYVWIRGWESAQNTTTYRL